MTQKTRVLIFVVAYDAESTIEEVLDRIPASVLTEYDHEILIVDDQSADRTFEKAAEYMSRRTDRNIRVLFNPESPGYGGNQKIGYEYAVQNNFDVVVLLHGDGQYAPEVMEEMIRPLATGEADAVLGSRMLEGGGALSGGMPLYKYVGNKILTSFQNRLLKTSFSEFHCGYRAYAVKALASSPFRFNTNDFHFDTEIIIQFLLRGCRIVEVPVPTYYGTEIRRVKGIAYAWNVLKATVRVRLHQMQLFYCRQYDCLGPRLEYPLKLGYPSSHTMAIETVREGSRVLDIGGGKGYVGRELVKKGCTVHGTDEAFFEGDSLFETFAVVDLNTQAVPFPFDDYDYILLLDILEHLHAHRQYDLLDDIRKRAWRRKPVLVITTANVAFLPLRLGLLLGQFNYGKRGILDQTHSRLFTFKSFKRMLIQSGYRLGKAKGIPAPFPAAIGDNRLSRLLLAINKALIKALPSLFAYQIFVTAHPLPTVAQLLADAEKRSSERHEQIGSRLPEPE